MGVQLLMKIVIPAKSLKPMQCTEGVLTKIQMVEARRVQHRYLDKISLHHIGDPHQFYQLNLMSCISSQFF